jgi:hypothetical protein
MGPSNKPAGKPVAFHKIAMTTDNPISPAHCPDAGHSAGDNHRAAGLRALMRA